MSKGAAAHLLFHIAVGGADRLQNTPCDERDPRGSLMICAFRNVHISIYVPIYKYIFINLSPSSLHFRLLLLQVLVVLVQPVLEYLFLLHLFIDFVNLFLERISLLRVVIRARVILSGSDWVVLLPESVTVILFEKILLVVVQMPALHLLKLLLQLMLLLLLEVAQLDGLLFRLLHEIPDLLHY